MSYRSLAYIRLYHMHCTNRKKKQSNEKWKNELLSGHRKTLVSISRCIPASLSIFIEFDFRFVVRCTLILFHFQNNRFHRYFVSFYNIIFFFITTMTLDVCPIQTIITCTNYVYITKRISESKAIFPMVSRFRIIAPTIIFTQLMKE